MTLKYPDFGIVTRLWWEQLLAAIDADEYTPIDDDAPVESLLEVGSYLQLSPSSMQFGPAELTPPLSTQIFLGPLGWKAIPVVSTETRLAQQLGQQGDGMAEYRSFIFSTAANATGSATTHEITIPAGKWRAISLSTIFEQDSGYYLRAGARRVTAHSGDYFDAGLPLFGPLFSPTYKPTIYIANGQPARRGTLSLIRVDATTANPASPAVGDYHIASGGVAANAAFFRPASGQVWEVMWLGSSGATLYDGTTHADIHNPGAIVTNANYVSHDTATSLYAALRRLK